MPPVVSELKGPVTFEFTPPGSSRSYLAAAEPVRLEPESEALGAIIVAKPRTELRDQWLPLVCGSRPPSPSACCSRGCSLVALAEDHRARAGASSAAREIAAGNYAVRVPAGGGGDEISRLSEQFNEMAARLAATEERERQFLMSVSHELRTPLTAIKGHVDAIRDGLFDDPELERASLDVVAGETIRLERLVGDVLDLAKLNAHRFTVHARRSTSACWSSARTRASARRRDAARSTSG